MAGVINTTMNTTTDDLVTGHNATNNRVFTADTATYDPATDTVGKKDTVAGQMDNLLTQGSPYIDRAKNAGAQYANSRGLLNSSIGATAGEAAAIDAVLPVAQQDATTNWKTGQGNMTAKNEAGQFNVNQTNLNSRFNATERNDFGQIAAAGEQDRLTTKTRGEIDIQLQKMRGNQAVNLANVEGQYSQLISASKTAGDLYSSAISMMGIVLANTDTSAEQKQAAVDYITGQLEVGLKLVAGFNNVNVDDLINFDDLSSVVNAPAGNTTTTSNTVTTGGDALVDNAVG